MVIYYLFVLLPLILGFYLWKNYRNITLNEWLLGILICIFIAICFSLFDFYFLPKLIKLLELSPNNWLEIATYSIITIITQTWYWLWAINNNLNKFRTNKIGITTYINLLSIKHIKRKYISRK